MWCVVLMQKTYNERILKLDLKEDKIKRNTVDFKKEVLHDFNITEDQITNVDVNIDYNIEDKSYLVQYTYTFDW